MRKGLSIFFISIAISACATSSGSLRERDSMNPLLALDAFGEFDALDPDAAVYLALDSQETRPLLDLLNIGGITGGQTGQLLDKTTRIAAAFYPKDAGKRFLAVCHGDYPNVLAALSLTASADWKKVRAWNNAPYWRSDASALSLALNDSWALVSDAEPFASATRAVTPREEFDAFRQGAAIAGWITDGGVSLNNLLYLLEIPIELYIQSAFFAVNKIGAQYEINVRLEIDSEEQAKGVVTLFSLARLFIGQNSDSESGTPALARPLLANPLEQSGQVVNMRSGAMTGEEVALLFNTFMLCL
ncbi:MAG: hypothetical protein LBH85_03755 [Treponema sp.]|nr:hypothetical protein [Treponema sp.]